MKNKNHDEIETIWKANADGTRTCVDKAICYGSVVFKDGDYDTDEEFLLLVLTDLNSREYYIDGKQYSGTKTVKIKRASIFSPNGFATYRITCDFTNRQNIWLFYNGSNLTFSSFPSGYNATSTIATNLSNFKEAVKLASQNITVYVNLDSSSETWGFMCGDFERHFNKYSPSSGLSDTIIGKDGCFTYTVNYPNDIVIFNSIYGQHYKYTDLLNGKYFLVGNTTMQTSIIPSNHGTYEKNQFDITTLGYDKTEYTAIRSMPPLDELKSLNWYLKGSKVIDTTNYKSTFCFVPTDEYGRILSNLYSIPNTGINSKQYNYTFNTDIWTTFNFNLDDGTTTVIRFTENDTCKAFKSTKFSDFKRYDRLYIKSLHFYYTDEDDIMKEIKAEMNKWSISDFSDGMLFIPIVLTKERLQQIKNAS